MSQMLHPEAQPIIDAFLKNGGVSFEKMGEIPALRAGYEANCALATMRDLDHIQTRDIQADISGAPIHLRLYDRELERIEARPTVLFIHGGGWVIGNLNSHDSICRKIADSADVRVIAVDYRLAPEHAFPVPYCDCENALQYIIANKETLNVNVERMVFCGDSAGANLVAHLGQNFYQKYQIKLKAQVLLYPVIGFYPESASYEAYTIGFPLIKSTMHWFFDQLVENESDKAKVSLLDQPFDSANGEIYLLTLEHDPLRDEALLYLQRAIQSGISVEYHHLSGLMHGIFTLAGKLPVAEAYLGKIGKYIANKI